MKHVEEQLLNCQIVRLLEEMQNTLDGNPAIQQSNNHASCITKAYVSISADPI